MSLPSQVTPTPTVLTPTSLPAHYLPLLSGSFLSQVSKTRPLSINASNPNFNVPLPQFCTTCSITSRTAAGFRILSQLMNRLGCESRQS